MRSVWVIYFNEPNPAEVAAVCSSLRFAVSLVVSEMLRKNYIQIEDISKARARLREGEFLGYKIVETPINKIISK